MTQKTPDTAAFLPGLGLSPTEPHELGEVERATVEQIDALREMGYIEAHHAGQVALARVTARALDRSIGKGAASGQANLSRAMKEIFEMLPQPEAASSDALDKALVAIMEPHDAADV